MTVLQHNLRLSYTAVDGLKDLAEKMAFSRHAGISRALQELAIKEVEFDDNRPQEIKDLDSHTRPRIWITDESRRPLGLGDLPIAYLLKIAKQYEIHPLTIQRPYLFGQRQRSPWYIKVQLGRFSDLSMVTPVIEAMGLGWLSPNDAKLVIPNAERSARQRRNPTPKKWVGLI